MTVAITLKSVASPSGEDLDFYDNRISEYARALSPKFGKEDRFSLSEIESNCFSVEQIFREAISDIFKNKQTNLILGFLLKDLKTAMNLLIGNKEDPLKFLIQTRFKCMKSNLIKSLKKERKAFKSIEYSSSQEKQIKAARKVKKIAIMIETIESFDL